MEWFGNKNPQLLKAGGTLCTINKKRNLVNKMNLEKLINILYYNLNLIDYSYRKFLLIYLNPFVWFSNLSKIKLGRKLFFEHMEKNFPRFDHLYKNDRLTQIFFFLYFNFLVSTIISILFFLTKLQFNYIIYFILSSMITLIISAIYIYKDDKYYSYQKEFYLMKKYNFTFVFITSSILIFVLNVYLLSLII